MRLFLRSPRVHAAACPTSSSCITSAACVHAGAKSTSSRYITRRSHVLPSTFLGPITRALVSFSLQADSLRVLWSYPPPGSLHYCCAGVQYQLVLLRKILQTCARVPGMSGPASLLLRSPQLLLAYIVRHSPLHNALSDRQADKLAKAHSAAGGLTKIRVSMISVTRISAVW